MATATSSSSSITSRPTYSCIRCAERKVKCDRQRPCSSCMKHNVDCVFNLSQPPQKKRVRHQVLTDRLRLYEALLQEHGIDPNKPLESLNPDRRRILDDFRLQTPSSTESETTRSVSKTQVVHGQGCFKLVDK